MHSIFFYAGNQIAINFLIFSNEHLRFRGEIIHNRPPVFLLWIVFRGIAIQKKCAREPKALGQGPARLGGTRCRLNLQPLLLAEWSGTLLHRRSNGGCAFAGLASDTHHAVCEIDRLPHRSCDEQGGD